ncbi:MAG: ABC transporter ATP-binding protein, partial [Oscillospiraceae bacterium]|nr:ABC transporter ATP-binding protein [Oscillospiraceae bacterium]
MPRGPLKPGQKPKDPFSTFGRVISYAKEYTPLLILVVVLIIISSLAGIIGTSFMQKIIDLYILPMADQGRTDTLVSQFIGALATMMCVYVMGAASSFIYSRILLKISTQILFRLRKDVFTHMETLPIRYFDTNTHGDIMSRYTNDIDTIRELLSNTFSSFIQSTVTVVGVFSMMIWYSWQLTLLTMVMMVVLLVVTGAIAKNGGKFFVVQQAALGKLNGYIEEMMDGQKVVKVFVHEKKATEEF